MPEGTEPSTTTRPGVSAPEEGGGPIVVRGDDGRHYRVVEKLGQGGFATVYRVWVEDLAGLRRQVALKVLKDEVPQEVAVRFRDEARMLGLVQHRAIVGIEGLVHLEGQLAVILEYIPGVDLKAIIDHQPPPTTVVLRLVEEVASALHAAWSQTNELMDAPLRLIHRDIKPANVRLTAGGEVRVVDFGGARADFGSREASTQSFVVGSYRYMAPERLDLMDTPASDIYSLGLVMAELLVGTDGPSPSKHGGQHDAWRHDVLQRARAQVETELHPTRVVERIVDLLGTMLDYLPEQRPAARDVELSVRELLEAVRGPTLREWAERVVPSLERARRSVATPVGTRRSVFPASADHQVSFGGSIEQLIAPLPQRQVPPRAGGVQGPLDAAKRAEDTAPVPAPRALAPGRSRDAPRVGAVWGAVAVAVLLQVGAWGLRQADNPLLTETSARGALDPAAPLHEWTPWPEVSLQQAPVQRSEVVVQTARPVEEGAVEEDLAEEDPEELFIPEPEPHEGRPERPLRFPFGRRR